VTCAFSGGADSTALIVLAKAAGCIVTAVHVDHGIRPAAAAEAARAGAIAVTVGVPIRRIELTLKDGPNLEARAREARREVLPTGALTGHTADDQAETVLINLMRGAGTLGLAGIRPGPTKPILGLRRAETLALCSTLGLDVVDDPSNADPRFIRNRVRHELIPLLDDIAGRDVTALLARAAELVGDDAALLDELAQAVDPTDAKAVAAADPRLARRALRAWLAAGGYPPDRATVERVMDVARGTHRACEIGRGRRVERKDQRLSIVHEPRVASNPGMGRRADGRSH
jgi:tRNA(Ile)-lysidine synthase